MTEHRINADLGETVAVDSSTLPWQASPSGSVWRKRFYLDGAAESGKVTSLVRYEPNAHFPAHDHPEGEEIFVLEGVFSDEHGDWPAGSYLLNPEGFRHAPFSREGCLIFVRLRQHAGNSRQHVEINSDALSWQSNDKDSIKSKTLYRQLDFADHSALQYCLSGTRLPATSTYDREIFILSGRLALKGRVLGALSWLRIPANQKTDVTVLANCELLLNHFPPRN